MFSNSSTGGLAGDGKKKQSLTRLGRKKALSLHQAITKIERIEEEEALAKARFEQAVAKLTDQLCDEMGALSLQKGDVQNHAADIVSAAAISDLARLNSKRMVRQQRKRTKKPSKHKKVPKKAVVPYTQAQLTDALVHIVKCHYGGMKCSFRKAAMIYMDGKYGALTRVWKNNRVSEVLDAVKQDEAILYVASIPKPKVCLFAACLLVLFVANLLVVLQIGNPLWINHINRYHEMLMVSIIKYMAVIIM